MKGAQKEIYWAVENREGDYYLHGFESQHERSRWLWEKEGLTLLSFDGRGFPGDLPKRQNPLYNSYNHPVIWH